MLDSKLSSAIIATGESTGISDEGLEFVISKDAKRTKVDKAIPVSRTLFQLLNVDNIIFLVLKIIKI
ncbi:MAG: hypothetical protein K0U41_00740 [Gammaproteobacteria bacterium]|nr:hypothetical protein [Gammaproteobacteria bacterium]